MKPNLEFRIKQGVFLALAAAFFILPWVFPALRNHAPGVAVICGVIFAVAWGNPFEALTAKLTSPLLGAAIVGMGFGMNLVEVLKAGAHGIVYTLVGIAMGLGLGVLLGKRLGLQKNTMYLISVGTSICGGSAIAAVAPAVDASEKEISVSLGVVFLLNSVALILFPAIGHLLGLTQHQFGMWSAIAIHDTSSVVGAASAYGSEALEVATTVKLARALWIIPVSLLSALLFRSKGKKISIPWFIGFFILAMLANSYLPFVDDFNTAVVTVSKAALVVTLFLIGAGLSVSKIREVGFKPLLLGVTLWVAISVLSLVAICHL